MRRPTLWPPPVATFAGARILSPWPKSTRSTTSRRHGSSAGGKPAEGSTAEQNEHAEIDSTIETAGGRARSPGAAQLRNRQSRRRTPSSLPPVRLPPSFDKNISMYTPGNQPRLSFALLEDSRNLKTSTLYDADSKPYTRRRSLARRHYFEAAFNTLLLRQGELSKTIAWSLSDEAGQTETALELAKRALRAGGMALDAASHLVDALHPSSASEHQYSVRPFWWWHVCKSLGYDVDLLDNHDGAPFASNTISQQLQLDELLDYPLAHAVVDVPMETLIAIRKSIAHELHTSAPENFDTKSGKRPITVLSMSGFGGKSIAEAVGQHLALWNEADLIYLDAYDLSTLVGGYLGQDSAYSRGAVSMMGFRAAELNGKLIRESSILTRAAEDDENDADGGVLGLGSASGHLTDELQKARQGGYDCFGKWESLKIDKVLDHIIHATEARSSSNSGQHRRIIIHLHDIVELSMTLEGSLLIGKLRNVVDAAWRQGLNIAIFGTSSCEQPSEEYQAAIYEMSVTDLVITRHLKPDLASTWRNAASPKLKDQFHLQEADYFEENISNINRMIRTLSASVSPTLLDLSNPELISYLYSPSPGLAMLRQSILPLPEIYHLACAVQDVERDQNSCGHLALLERCRIGPLQQKPPQVFLYDDSAAGGGEDRDSHRKSEEPKRDGKSLAKLNEYEKRVASGQINRENLRTTFADVHVPSDTISALKLLTSLALVRPDAFSYGVLAQDKIPGCLLYGPPGTGKTMLAKAVAKESGANMLEVSGATINDKWVGESEKLIRAVFTLAKRLSPCVVFIDEADSLLANRGMFSNRASHREHINQFLKEWDGMEETSAFIMVATNRPFDLDDAVLRRLPRKILVDLPLTNDRGAILQLLLRGETLEPSVSILDIADRTPYYSGSDLKNVCVAAAMAAVEEENEAAAQHEGTQPYQYPERRVLLQRHFEKAMQQIPASISEDMASLRMIKKFDQEYGSNRDGKKKKAGMGFGLADEKTHAAFSEGRIRPESA